MVTVDESKLDAAVKAEYYNGDPDHLENVTVRIHCRGTPMEGEAQALAHNGVDDPYAPQWVFTGRLSRMAIASLSRWDFVIKLETMLDTQRVRYYD